MATQQAFEQYITRNPAVLSGKPIIRGTRVAVELIADFISNGATIEEIVDDYPDLTREEVEAAIAYSEWVASHTEVRPGSR